MWWDGWGDFGVVLEREFGIVKFMILCVVVCKYEGDEIWYGGIKNELDFWLW